METFKNGASELSIDSLEKCYDEYVKMSAGRGKEFLCKPTIFYVRPLWVSEEDFLNFLKS